MDTTVSSPASGEPFREAAAKAVAGDPLTAQLLAKHAAGEKLTQSEYGKIGAWAKVKNFLSPKSGGPDGPVKPGSGAGHAAGVAPVAPGQTSGDGLGAVPPNPGLVQRTTGAILKQCDRIARGVITRKAKAVGSDDKTVARLDSAAALPQPSQELMTEVSPDVLQSLGIEPTNYPLIAFFGALGLWGTNLWLAVDELNQIEHRKRVERLTEQGKRVPPGAVTVPGVPGVTGQERPADPPGTMKVFCETEKTTDTLEGLLNAKPQHLNAQNPQV